MNVRTSMLMTLLITMLFWSPNASLAQSSEARQQKETFNKIHKKASGVNQDLVIFWKSFKDAILRNNSRDVANLCAFPIANASNVVDMTGPTVDYDEELFFQHFDKIFGPYAVHQLIRTSVYDLHVNGTKAYFTFTLGEPVTDEDGNVWEPASVSFCFDKFGCGYMMEEIQVAG